MSCQLNQAPPSPVVFTNSATPPAGSTGGVVTQDPNTGAYSISVPTLKKYTTSWTSQTSVTVTHNLGTTALLWQVFDATGNSTDGPETFTSGGANSFTITFGAAFTGSIVVIG